METATRGFIHPTCRSSVRNCLENGRKWLEIRGAGWGGGAQAGGVRVSDGEQAGRAALLHRLAAGAAIPGGRGRSAAESRTRCGRGVGTGRRWGRWGIRPERPGRRGRCVGRQCDGPSVRRQAARGLSSRPPSRHGGCGVRSGVSGEMGAGAGNVDRGWKMEDGGGTRPRDHGRQGTGGGGSLRAAPWQG